MPSGRGWVCPRSGGRSNGEDLLPCTAQSFRTPIPSIASIHDAFESGMVRPNVLNVVSGSRGPLLAPSPLRTEHGGRPSSGSSPGESIRSR